MNKISIMLLASIIVLSGLMTVGVQNASAVTFVEGHVTVDTTWTVADAPYVVSNDIYVDDGATLTIEPGVEIRFGGAFNIFVDGNLSAIGTSDDEIIFTSNKLTPAPGDWNTIDFDGTGFRGAEYTSLHMKHCLVEYAEHGVTLDSWGRGDVISCDFVNNSESGVHVMDNSNVLIKGNVLKFSKYGIKGDYVSGYISGCSIVNNKIVNNTQYGVYVYNPYKWSDSDKITISNNTISYNAGDGVYVYANRNVYDISISNNTISYNAGDGVCVYADEDAYNITISNNAISSNDGHSVYVHSTWGYSVYNITISNNAISSNAGDGVYVHSTTGHRVYNIAISNNTISYNAGDGVCVYAEGDAYNISISNNTISSNDGHGVYVRSTWGDSVYNITIANNTISSNDGHGVYVRADDDAYNITGKAQHIAYTFSSAR